MAATTTTVNDDIREALMGILDAQDGLICPGCGKVYFHVDDALSDDDDAQWDVDMHDDGCQVVEGIASIKAYREQQYMASLTATMAAPKTRCAGKVWTKRGNVDMREQPCSRNATVGDYCRTHDPATIRERHAAKLAAAKARLQDKIEQQERRVADKATN